MKLKTTALLFMLALAVNLHGQNSHRFTRHSADTVSRLVKSYTDSLDRYKLQIDSLQRVNASLNRMVDVTNGKYSKLFLPMTFYHDISRNQFRLSEDPVTNSTFNAALERALLNVYLKRPDLVTNTQTRLDAQGQVSTSQETTINTKTDIVEKVAPAPAEAQIIPIDLMITKPNFWKFGGDGYLQFLQNYVSGNWYKGGESNYSMLGSVTLTANYNNKQKVKWDNKLELKLGFQTSKSDTLHNLKTHTDDIRYTGSLGLQATKHWYYSLQLIANTQFMRGYRNNDTRVYSDFLSPLNVELSLGMRYNVNWLKGKLTGSVNIAPLAYHYRYVGRDDLVKSFGIEEGKHYVDDYGSSLNIDLNWKFTDAVSWKTRLYGYTSYKRAELEWENTFSFRFTKYLSTNLYVYPRFDDSRKRDDHHGYFMYKEFLSIGFTYSF